MNLLLVNYEYPPIGGGAANATQCLGNAFAKLGHSVDVLTSGLCGADGESLEGSLRIHRLPINRPRADLARRREMFAFMWQSSRAISKLQRRHRFDAAICFFTIPSGPAGLRLHRGWGPPFIVSLRGGDVPGHVPGLGLMHTLSRPLRRAVLRHAAAIVANSESLAATSRAADPFPVGVIANGVDCERFSPLQTRILDAKFRLLFVGRVHPEKNLRVVIDQLAALPEVELWVAGDGAQRPELAAHAEALDVSARIRWLGWQQKTALPDLYREATALVNPSFYEGSPNVVLEAMASGLPTVASDTPGNRSVVRDGKDGLLFSLSKPDDLRVALARLVNDRAFAVRLGLEGRRRAEQEFSWNRAAQSYLELLPISPTTSAPL